MVVGVHGRLTPLSGVRSKNLVQCPLHWTSQVPRKGKVTGGEDILTLGYLDDSQFLARC